MDFLKEKVTKGSAKQERGEKEGRWYVNVDENMAEFQVGKDHFTFIDQNAGPFGPVMEIDATLHSNNTKKNYEAGWALTPDTNNTDPSLQNSPKASLQAATTTEQKQTANDEVLRRFFTNKINLPDIGGNRYKIVVTKKNTFKANREILQLDVETWRRLWFTIFWTDDSQKSLINDVVEKIKNIYEPAKIDLVHVPATTKLDYDHAETALVESYLFGEDFTKAPHGGQHPVLQRDPFHIQIVMVKGCAKLHLLDVKGKFKIEGKPRGGGIIFDKASGLVSSISFSVLGNFELLDNEKIKQVEKLRGAYIFKQTVKSLNVTIDGVVKPPITNIIIDRLDSKTFTFKPTGPLGYIATALKDKKEVDLHFKIEAFDSTLAGVNDGNKIITSTHDKGAIKSADEISKILIHEIGHALGLVPNKIYAWQHPQHYTDLNGGQGPHCWFNAQLDGKNIYRYGGKGKMCIMYHQVHDHAGPEFCENCMKYLKFTKLRKNDLKYGDSVNFKKPWK